MLALIALALRVPYQSGVIAALAPAASCPERPRHVRPFAFHFQSSMQEHQSWLEATVAEPDATDFVLCLDGKLVDVGIGETPLLGQVEISVRTRWVDAQWLLGALPLYEVSDRWDIGYTTYTLMNARAR